jgi:hypothetical protein
VAGYNRTDARAERRHEAKRSRYERETAGKNKRCRLFVPADLGKATEPTDNSIVDN